MSSEAIPSPRVCSIADALEVVGDRWALLAIRELAFGVARFNDIQRNTGAPRASLSARLRELEASGLVVRRRYSEHPPRDEYLLTDCGAALAPVLGALREWGERFAPRRAAEPRAAGTSDTSGARGRAGTPAPAHRA